MGASKPVVALVGRPNVGKSTLFNRLAGRRIAIVEDLPGTTRDRLYATAEWGDVSFLVVDTGGLTALETPQGKAAQRPRRRAQNGTKPPIGQTAGVESGLFLEEMRRQAYLAIEEADVVVFLVDAEVGLTPDDREIANVLRRSRKPVLLVANKADSARRSADAVEFYALGLGDPIAISALHGLGTGDLLERIVEALASSRVLSTEDEETAQECPQIAIVGRPNVGKSSLLNRLLGEERIIVSEVPGTTRDAIDTRLNFAGQPLVLIDTAGIRRRGRITPGVEKHSVLRTMKAINRADVCLLVLDARDRVTAQDQHIAGYILEEAKSAVIVVNKWDAVEKNAHTMQEYTQQIRSMLGFMDYVPVLFVSALTGQRVHQVLEVALQVWRERRYHISTSDLNQLVQDAVARHPPKSRSGRQLRFYYATQAEVDPPTFIFFVNDPELVHFSYERYLENRIRELYHFTGTPLRLVFRGHAKKEDKR
ncbi:MAG: ribosome biogenesis GTPase Der [Ardenticatenia bacterium]|nr:MAG: ribosome biogenesis GTPase Der [Ardenticatenia bacterium]